MGKQPEIQNDMEWRVSLSRVEALLNYNFNDRKLLEEALTHSSCRNHNRNTVSYQRLEFLGDAVLTISFSDFFFRKYPELGEGKLTLLKQANITNEKLARVAVRHRLYDFLRTIAPVGQEVEEFALAVQQEEEIETTVYGGVIKPPDILADIVESVVGAVYFDCGSDIKVAWQVIVDFLQPIITLDKLPSPPMTKLCELCQKQGKRVFTKVWRDQNINNCSIYVDGELFATGSSDRNKDIAKLKAVREALEKVNPSSVNRDISSFFIGCYELSGIEDPKLKLNNLCALMKWDKPGYSTVKEEGPAHKKKFVRSVKIKTGKEKLSAKGDEKPRKIDAENSAASSMMRKLAELCLSGELSAE